MLLKINTPDEYIQSLPSERQEVMTTLRHIIKQNLPSGFEECMSYGMIGYVVPKSLYSAGYHCDTKLPLPFLSLASQKSHIAIYHMAMLEPSLLLEWFQVEFAKVSKKKLDMGKSCIRFKKAEDIPLVLIAELAKQLTPQDWIEIYEQHIKKSKPTKSA
ncbi:MAG: DUF1801 domain-containing protein [Cytophagales bacterium]|nr:MAG: DUF1801 domain-containing protein [Cytophagales bacterium]TAF61559.1 MAG: DUF1801 domain-containing protein [Cytophagales bacterium]